MNKHVTNAFVLLALSLLIVPPVIDSVNVTSNGNADSNSVLFATGSPMPAPTPPVLDQSMLIATGSPMPAPTPPVLDQSTLIATGSPMPAPTPPLMQSVLSV